MTYIRILISSSRIKRNRKPRFIIIMIRCCLNELQKRMKSSAFWIGILLITVLCMTTSAYTDMMRGKNYSVFEAITVLSSEIRQSQISAFSVFTQGLNSPYATLFLPLAVSIGFVPLLCVERQSGALRYQLVRESKWRYCLGKIIGASLCGGLTVLLGFLLYGVIAWCFFSHTIPEEMYFMMDDPSVRILQVCISSFLTGMISVFPALLFCGFSNRQYPIMCAPVLLQFLLNTAIAQVSNQRIVELLTYLRPSGAGVLIYSFSPLRLAVVLLIPILCSIGFCCSVRKKVDCGA